MLVISSSLYGQPDDCKNEKPDTVNEDKKVSEKKDCEKKLNEKKDEDKKDDEKKPEDNKSEDNAKKEEENPPPIGNLALPTSQQPAALFGFGGNIIDKGEIQIYFFADEFVGKQKITVDLIPGFLFGITDDWSIFFNTPFTPEIKDGRYRSRGFEDFFIQLEYAFYRIKTYFYTDQATVVANVTFPTGSIKATPPTGFGAPSIFLGATFYRTWIDWFVFTAHGAVLTTSDHRTKFGDQFLYQFGMGRNIASYTDNIFAWMLEVDGQYNKRNRINGLIDPNSGGNTIYVTPSLWVSTKEMLIQFGVSLPINQNLFGKQTKFDYALNFNFAWSFY